MQQSGCEDIRLLISRFVDDEVTPAERVRVESHVAACDTCAYKLIELMEMAVLFAETPLRRPDPELRAEVFGEISRRKEAARRVEDVKIARRGERPWYLPAEPEPAAVAPFHVRLLRASSPFAVAAVALFFLLGALALGGWPKREVAERTVGVPPMQPLPPSLPTRDMPNKEAGVLPDPVGTAAANLQGPITSAAVPPTATLGRAGLIKLIQPTPVYESASAFSKTGWHVVRDPAYGYTVHYPLNWWTKVQNSTRYFYRWTSGGTRDAPYWIELRVSPNSLGLTAETGNEPVCGGKCDRVHAEGNVLSWLRREDSDNGTYHDIGYLFDSNHIYELRLSVPKQSLPELGPFKDRLAESQQVFALMSGRLAPASGTREDDPAFGGVLFLNGTDLQLTNAVTGRSLRLTSGVIVRRFAQSPDLSRVAYTASDSPNDVWGKRLYLTRIVPSGPEAPTLLAPGMDFQDIAWYGDRTLLAIARDAGGQLGLYRFTLPDSRTGAAAPTDVASVLLTVLDDRLTGARALAVSPDRQLITFLAPVGPSEGTDLYAVRPDGSGLGVLVGHAEPLSPLAGGTRALAPENQALKDYVWVDGRLEEQGYAATILFTCGDSYSPNYNLGGYLYSTSNNSRNPALDTRQLERYDAEGMQIVHVAYSRDGKVAITGYVNDRNNRSDQLVGLWTADLVNGAIINPRRMPAPDSPNGITDLQWTPDGTSLIYRETVPYGPTVRSARYDGVAAFRVVKLNVGTGQIEVLLKSDGRSP